jgi:hypothetical protein
MKVLEDGLFTKNKSVGTTIILQLYTRMNSHILLYRDARESFLEGPILKGTCGGGVGRMHQIRGRVDDGAPRVAIYDLKKCH